MKIHLEKISINEKGALCLSGKCKNHDIKKGDIFIERNDEFNSKNIHYIKQAVNDGFYDNGLHVWRVYWLPFLLKSSINILNELTESKRYKIANISDDMKCVTVINNSDNVVTYDVQCFSNFDKLVDTLKNQSVSE